MDVSEGQGGMSTLLALGVGGYSMSRATRESLSEPLKREGKDVPTTLLVGAAPGSTTVYAASTDLPDMYEGVKQPVDQGLQGGHHEGRQDAEV